MQKDISSSTLLYFCTKSFAEIKRYRKKIKFCYLNSLFLELFLSKKIITSEHSKLKWISGIHPVQLLLKKGSTMRTVLKVVPPILLCWPTVSEVDIGVMAVEVEPSRQYSVPCCCYATDGSRGAMWQNSISHGSADEAKVWDWIPPYGKNCACWHLLMLAECW